MNNTEMIKNNLEDCRRFVEENKHYFVVEINSYVDDEHERMNCSDIIRFLRSNRYTGTVILNDDSEHLYLLVDPVHLKMCSLWSETDEFVKGSLAETVIDLQQLVMIHTSLRGPFLNRLTITEKNGKRTVLLEAEGYYDKAYTFTFFAPNEPQIIYNYGIALSGKTTVNDVVAIRYFELENRFNYVCVRIGDQESIRKYLFDCDGKAISYKQGGNSYWMLNNRSNNDFLLFADTKDSYLPYGDIGVEKEHMCTAVFLSTL